MTQCLYANSNGTWKKVVRAYRNIKDLPYTQAAHLYYDCDSGSTIDISPNNYSPATFTGSIVAGELGRGGKVYRFDPNEGMDTNVSINMANNDVTICAWFWFDSIPSNQSSIFLVLKSTALAVSLEGGSLYLRLTDTAGNMFYKNFGTYSQYFGEKEWVHVTATWSSYDKFGALYINGIYLDSVSMDSGSTPKTTEQFRTPNSDSNGLLMWMDDPQIHLYRYTQSDSTRYKIRYLMDGIGVWSECNKIYANDAGTWKRSHFSPYNGNAIVDVTFSSVASGNGVTDGDTYHNESRRDQSILYFATNGGISRVYRGGIDYVGYKIYADSGETWQLSKSSFPTIDLNTCDATVTCWVYPYTTTKSVQRIISLINEALVVRFEASQLRIYMQDGNGYTCSALTTTGIAANNWYFCVGLWDHSLRDMRVRLYNDDMSVNRENSNTFDATKTPKTATGFTLSSNNSESLEGGMCLVRIFDRLLRSSEIPYIARETWGNG